jgi:hypothetical protein
MTLVYAATISTVCAGLLVFGLFFFVSNRKSRNNRTPSNADLLETKSPPTAPNDFHYAMNSNSANKTTVR